LTSFITGEYVQKTNVRNDEKNYFLKILTYAQLSTVENVSKFYAT